MNNAALAIPLYESIIETETLSESNIQESKELFERYAVQGIIQNTSFDDERWAFSDEYENVGMIFSIDELTYKRIYEPIFGFNVAKCVEYIKAYIILTLGKNVLVSIRNALNDIKDVLKTDYKTWNNDSVNLRMPLHAEDFFSILPCNSPDGREELLRAICAVAEISFATSTNKRNLAQFQSYFRFDELIKQYWSQEIPLRERMFFYPVYLWWRITAIIPLRPREFILTPRNCIHREKDSYYLTLRRNRLKGSSRVVNYNIDQDYIQVRYEIPHELAEAILYYIKETERLESNQLDTLLRTEFHYAYFDQKKHQNSRYYTYVNLCCCLRLFYKNILLKKMGMSIIRHRDIGKVLAEKELEYIYLGDTRHIAMINIIVEGGSPVIAMLLAGHSDIATSSHYYSNITNLIECKTYMKYRKSIEGSEQFLIGSNFYPPQIEDKQYIELEDGGRCYSPKFLTGDISDCNTCCGKFGEIGYCPECTYYRQKGFSYFLKEDSIYRSKIEEDYKLLSRSVERVRAGLGFEEDIREAFLRLENSSFNYEKYCIEKINHQYREDDNG
ncbi:hypothetical protein [Lacrimispora sp.]|uniref:hypothetical protein n=1 Tax=Lacrimispora sp. TaxID=2719234 RepID=UPI002FD93A3C